MLEVITSNMVRLDAGWISRCKRMFNKSVTHTQTEVGCELCSVLLGAEGVSFLPNSRWGDFNAIF